MARQINATTIAALQSDAFNLCHLIEMHFSPVIYITDWNRSISALSQTFVSSAHILDIGESSETAEIKANTMQIEMSGVSQEYIAIFLLNNNYMNKQVRIWKAVLGADDSVVGEPFVVFDGIISSYSIDDTEDSSSITIDVSTHWKDFELRKGRMTNRNSQQLYYPADKGLDFASTAINNLKWGKI